MRLVMIGSGYVGLVSGACFADFGHSVICVDKVEARIDTLNKGLMPIFEPGLAEIVRNNVNAGRLKFSIDLADAIKDADVVFIAVGTPSRRGDGHADLAYVHAAAEEVARAARGYCVLVTKSTVPVGTGDEVERIVRRANPSVEIDVVSNPEFLREGSAISDFKRPDRIVVGTDSERAEQVMRAVYRPLYLNEAPIIVCERRTSELIKYAGNAFLAMKISFINEMADLCEKVGADVQKVAKGIGLDKRIGDKFLHAGPGYGGSCFPKDTVALVKMAQDHDMSLALIEATVNFNDRRKRAMARKVIAACGGDVRDRKIAVLGLTFKPNTDDMREAPSISIIQALQDSGAVVHAYDPEGMEAAKALLNDVNYGANAYDIAEDADALVIVTEWDVFRALDFRRLKGIMRNPVVVDLHNIYNGSELVQNGFSYVGIGR
jgi:UDPglucose 6-dehydrogenase